MKIKCNLDKNEIGVCDKRRVKGKNLELGKEFDGFVHYWYVKVNGKEVRSGEDPFLSKSEAIRDYEKRINKNGKM